MIHNTEELNALRDNARKTLDIRLDRTESLLNKNEIHILVCGVLHPAH